MKLRNKKDGTITEGAVWIETKVHGEPWHCESIEELNAHWEDYKPKEPLIKDEKVRKAVRAWAEAANTRTVDYWYGDLASLQNDSIMTIDGGLGIEDGNNYTIEELCGEEEE